MDSGVWNQKRLFGKDKTRLKSIYMTVHPRYNEIIEECKKLVNVKNIDYTANRDPLYNLRYIENFDIPAWQGVLARITDKWTRFESLIKTRNQAVKDERLEDTIKDMINYLIFFIILYEENKNEI